MKPRRTAGPKGDAMRMTSKPTPATDAQDRGAHKAGRSERSATERWEDEGGPQRATPRSRPEGEPVGPRHFGEGQLGRTLTQDEQARLDARG
jgi:hypothetical protein